MEDERIEIRDHRVPGWFWVDNEVVDEHGWEIGVYGLAVYCCLARHADNRTQECWPSVDLMAYYVHTGVHQVLKALEILEKEGLIEVERRPGQSNRYTLCAVKPTVAAEAGVKEGPLPEKQYPLPQKQRTVAAEAVEQDLTTRQKNNTNAGGGAPLPGGDQKEAETALLEAGVSQRTARRLAANFPAARIMIVVAAAKKDPSVRNVPAWIAAALDRHFETPKPAGNNVLTTKYQDQIANCFYRLEPLNKGCLKLDPKRVPWAWCERCDAGKKQ